MVIKKLVVGQLEENCYVVADENTSEAMVIDPGDEPDRIMDVIKKNKFKVTTIVCTHAHFDHVGVIDDIQRATGAKILINEGDKELYIKVKDQAALWGFDLGDMPFPDGFLNEGDALRVGGLSFKVMHTPGHSPGGICLFGEGIVISGDTLFQGSVGRTDFHGGDINQLKESFRRLLSLPEETVVYAGHGGETTIGREKRENMFVSEFL